ncbi:MAG: hypothetical protein ACRDTE_06615 [Pseudonocardiaceae bacterium]
MAALFIFLLAVVVVALLISLGYLLAHDKLADDQAELEQQRQALDMEWQALENGRRVSEVFFRARQTMRDVARERRPRA